MSPHLTLAKITRPRLNRVYSRKRLFKLLNRLFEYPVIWVSAPPGSGKTTLINSYVSQNELNNLWYQFDERDSDIATFFHYLSLAVKATTPIDKHVLPHLTAEYRMGLKEFSRSYFEQVYSCLEKPSVLVFDNFQEVRRYTELHTVISIGLEVIPRNINVIVVSRNDPPPALMRLQANSLMAIVKADELNLTLAEAKGIARKRGYKNKSPDVIEKLTNQTNGWVSGLVLALNNIEHDSCGDILNETPGDIFDYFASEVFSCFDEPTQHVLLMSAFLPKMTYNDLINLTGLKKSPQILQGLFQQNYFISVRRSADPIYEYHPLFKDFLLAKANNLFSKSQIDEIQLKVAIILRDNSDLEHAIGLFLALHNYEEAVDSIKSCAKDLIAQGRYTLLESWISGLPETEIKKHCWLYYWLGLCRIITDPTDSYNIYSEVYLMFQKEGDTLGQLYAASAAIEAAFFESVDFTKMDIWIKAIDELTDECVKLNDIEAETLVAKNMLLALVWREPQHSKASFWVDNCAALWVYTEAPIMRSQLFLNMAMYHLYVGNISKCENIIRFTEQLIDSKDSPPLSIITTYMVAAFYHWNNCNFKDTENAINKGLSLSQKSGIHIFDGHLLSYGIYNALSTGNLKKADDLLTKLANTISKKPGHIDHGRLHMLTAWHGILSNDLIKAEEAAKLSVVITSKSGAIWPEYTCRCGYAHILFERGNIEEAYNQLEEARLIGSGLRSHRAEFECSIIESYFFHRQGATDSCIRRLQYAFMLGSKYGYMQLYFWRPDVMTELSIVALENQIEVDYTRSLILKRCIMPLKPPSHLANWPWRIKIFTLGEFRIIQDDAAIEVNKRSINKQVELLKVLLAYGGRNVPEEKIMDALWGESEGDHAKSNFKTTLHRLRKILAQPDALIVNNSRLSLNDRYCWVDAWSLIDVIEQSTSINAMADEDRDKAARKLMHYYKGHFFANESAPWSISPRESIQRKFFRCALNLAEALEKDIIETADACYQHLLDIDPLSKPVYQGLIRIYKIQGKDAEVELFKQKLSDLAD